MMRRRSSKGLKPIKIERSVRGTLSQDDQEDDDALVDFNSLYVKGEQTVPLESPIKRELTESAVGRPGWEWWLITALIWGVLDARCLLRQQLCR
jgi:hypothetical protein